MAKNSGVDISNASIGPDDHLVDHKKADQYDDDTDRDVYRDEEDYPSMDDDMLHEDAFDAEDTHTQKVDKADDTTDTDTEVKDLRNAIESTPLSWSRVPFAKQAKALLDKIEIIMKTTEDDESEQPQDENTPELDPMAVQMVSGVLSKRMAYITRGVDYAVSAKVLLDALENDLKDNIEQFHADLIGLVVGTVYHAKIASDEFAEFLFMTLSEFDKEKRILEEENEESCVSQLTFMCPSSPYSKDLSDGSSIEFPPKWVVSVAQGLCANRQTGVCVPDDDLDIPADIPDGYYNYFVPQPRDDSDTLSAAFSAYDTIASIASQTAELENQLLDLDKKLKEYNDEVREMEESIGGGDGMEMGRDGELYPMRDQCFSGEAGKYDYEVCIFGSAKQRDIGQKTGGTDLGKWSGMEIDEESGQKTMLWKNGAKCWNGPQRSATVHVTCGAETKVLTADEPDTCRYVLTMESHMACDDQFGKQYGLL
uniref:MRH domain-containing protein n=1 Tax=Attheya septentrionalis TaxID=420275 RepID=A0A7S2UHB7_9STRA